MCELSTLLQVVKIDGRPLAFEHAVLISESGPEAASDWVVSILGVRASDFDWAVAARIFSATGSEGELYGGVVHSAPGSSAWHVRLQGSGALRAVHAHRDAPAGGDAQDLAVLH